jgi:PIN domain nuclease of toxin-antitoxin system
MGHYLLDTHAAIWFFNGENALSETAKQIILAPSNRKYLSMVSAWELAIKIGRGKLRFDGKTAGFVRLAQANDISVIHIGISHLTAFESLPWIHSDPFDRLLVATAICEQMTIITKDENIAQYGVPHIW